MNDLDRAKRYWRIALVFPIAGALTYPLWEVGAFLAWGMVLIGIPYAFFAAVMWALYGRATCVKDVVLRAAGWPIFFAPFYMLYCVVAAFLMPGADAKGFLTTVLAVAATTAVVGYAFFALSLAGYHLAERLATGTLRRSSAPRP